MPGSPGRFKAGRRQGVIGGSPGGLAHPAGGGAVFPDGADLLGIPRDMPGDAAVVENRGLARWCLFPYFKKDRQVIAYLLARRQTHRIFSLEWRASGRFLPARLDQAWLPQRFSL